MKMKPILYSTGCPKCNVLKKKLAEKNIDFEENNSVEDMLLLSIVQVPMLQVEGKIMNYKESVEWVNNQ